MPVLSHGEIADLWVKAGGNPQYADTAASAAIRKSGGRTDAEGGLWGLDTPGAGLDPMADTRTAVFNSANGIDFGWVTDWLAEQTGIANFGRAVYYAALIPAGLFFISIGMFLIVFGSKPVKAAFRLVGEQAVGGLGFGVGAAIVPQPRGRSFKSRIYGQQNTEEFPPVTQAPTSRAPTPDAFTQPPRQIEKAQTRDPRVISGEWSEWGGPRGDWTPPKQRGLSWYKPRHAAED